jgi:hypothetical protein
MKTAIKNKWFNLENQTTIQGQLKTPADINNLGILITVLPTRMQIPHLCPVVTFFPQALGKNAIQQLPHG